MPRPNLVIIICDDLGVRDLGCTGSTFYETPCLDRFAAEGVVCANAYSTSPVCSPARASLHTGRHCARVGITNWIPGNPQGRLLGAPYRHELGRDQRTLAQALAAGGYDCWHVGKWHLGGVGHLPTDFGFALNIGGGHFGGPGHFGGYVAPWLDRRTGQPCLPGLEDAPAGQFLTDRLTDEAIRLIRGAGARPFFLHLAHYAPHTPIQAPAELVERFRAKARRLNLAWAQPIIPGEALPILHQPEARVQRRIVQSDPVYAALLANLDLNTGRLLAAIEESGHADDTLVVFTSDNGGLATAEGSPTCNLPWAEGKGWLEEGGLRIPQLWRWPAGLPAATTCHAPLSLCDLFPSFLAAAGLPAEPQSHCDGSDALPVLRDAAAPACEALFWHYPHYSNQGGGPGSAVRCGAWKLIHLYDGDQTRLYHLGEDPGECRDRSREQPALAHELRARLDAWRQAVGAVAPVVNPWYEDIVAGRLPRPDGNGAFPAGTLLPGRPGGGVG